MWWTADPPRPFQLRPVPICSALRFLVAGLLPAFIFRRISRLSQGIALSYRVTLMVRPLLLAEPGPGDAPCTTWALSVCFHPLHFPAGRPSSRFAFCTSPVLRPLPFNSSLSIFLVRFRSRDLLLPLPISRPSPSASSLSAFSVLPAIPTFRLVGFCLTGDLSYS